MEFETACDDEERAAIVRVRAVRLDGQACFETDGPNALASAFEQFNNRGAFEVFVWDMPFFGCFCDTYAARAGLTEYDKAEKKTCYKGKKIAVAACYSVLYGAAYGILNFRLSMPRTAKTHEFGGGRVGAMHSVEYRGLHGFFHGSTETSVFDALGIPQGDPLERGRALLEEFLRELSELSGEDATRREYLSSVYTVGGAARRAYLKCRYGVGRLPRYHKEHEATEAMDDYLRTRRLQLSGMCFFPADTRGVLHEGELYKYDVNGLYSATSNECGELTFPRASTFEEFERDRDPSHVYIIVVSGLIAFRRKDMPNVFMEPFGGLDSNIIDIPNEFAMFRELWDALHRFYIFEEFDVIKVLRMEKRHDSAIIDYNEKFQALKASATVEGNAVKRELAKNFLNNLVGKFTQRTRYATIVPKYDRERDIIDFERGEVIDNWEKGHFDFIRGAYIYTMARVRVMIDIANVCGGRDGAAAHHFYTDTDSIVTDLRIPAEYVDPVRLGAYKLERVYTAFGVMGKKVYYGRTSDGVDELTAAGMPKGAVMRYIRETYGDGLSPPEVWAILTSGARYELPYKVRVKGGAAVRYTLTAVGETDVDNLILYGED